MADWFVGLSPVWQALIASLFTWGVTALGAASVFAVKTVKVKLMDFMLGFAGGVMIAASFWSLLVPAIDMAEDVSSLPPWSVASIGFLGGGLFLSLLNRYVPHQHPSDKNAGKNTNRSKLLLLAITLHNIPEGLL